MLQKIDRTTHGDRKARRAHLQSLTAAEITERAKAHYTPPRPTLTVYFPIVVTRGRNVHVAKGQRRDRKGKITLLNAVSFPIAEFANRAHRNKHGLLPADGDGCWLRLDAHMAIDVLRFNLDGAIWE